MFKYYSHISPPVVNVTISLPEETVKKLRNAVRELYGGRRGALSGLVAEAIEDRIDALKAARPSPRFVALKDGLNVAEGRSLDELASKLRALNVDPRAVRIVSSQPPGQVARAGLRGRKT